MSKRYNVIGIKQVLRYEWMQKTSSLLLTGLDGKTLRQELHEFLLERKGDGSEGERSAQTRTFVVNNFMKIWVSPDPDLISLRDAALALLREQPTMALSIHWAMISAAYPFWFNVASQVGRLLNLQGQVTRQQIINRLKEQYGDRQTVCRSTCFVLRSFVAWGVLNDSQSKGCYKKSTVLTIGAQKIAFLLIETALHATKDRKGDMLLLTNSPAFFPFQLPVLTGDIISQQSSTIDVVRYGLDHELLSLRD